MSSPNRRGETEPASIEAVIPLHDTARPIRRTVRSLLDQQRPLAAAGATLEISIVCHNIAAASVRSVLGDELLDDCISLLELSDGIYSPAGPKNYALDRSGAEYITFVDSDDYLEPGALDAWLGAARRTGAAAVVAPIRMPGGAILASPRVRPSKPRIADPVRDGLATRSLPHGLLRRAELERIGFRYTAGLRSGEDLEPTLRLFFTGGPISYAYGSPAYCQTDDSGASRVTAEIGRLDEEFSWFAPLAQQDWLARASRTERSAIGTKLMRVHGIGALHRRGEMAARALAGDASGGPAGSLWNAGESAAWRVFHRGVEELAGDGLGALSIRDARFARAALETDDASGLALATQAYDSSSTWDVLITQHRHLALGRNSILRHYVDERRRGFAGVFTTPGPPVAAGRDASSN